MPVIRYQEALRMAMTEEMERDENVFLLGEEIGRYQGTYRVTEGLQAKFGEKRVVDTPISEVGIAGLATGAAMAGLRPVAEFMTWSFSLSAMDQIINHASKITYMSGGRITCPLVFRGPIGRGGQLSAQHSMSLEAWYAHSPGLKVVLPANPKDAKGLLKSAIRDPDPVIFMEHTALYSMKDDVSDDPEFTVPIGKAAVVREGKDVTIVAYSAMVPRSLKAAELLEKDGISCEVIDLRTLVPLDMETVVASVTKTHRAVVAQEDWKSYGAAGEIAARIYEQAYDELDAPVERIGGADVPMPYAKNLERAAIPSEQDVLAAVRRVTA